MAVWASRTAGGLRIRSLAVLPWAFGLCLAAAVLVPVIFELGEKPHNRRPVGAELMLAAVILCVTAAACRLTVLAIDPARRVLFGSPPRSRSASSPC